MTFLKSRNKEDKEKIGTFLKDAREKLGLPQRSAAIMMGINPMYLKSLEEGTTDIVPYFYGVVKICNVLKIDRDELLKLFYD